MYSSLAAVAKTTELPTCDVIAPLASLASLPVDQVVVEEEVTAEMECSCGEEAVGVVVEIVREGMEEKEDSRALFKVRKDNMVVVTVVCDGCCCDGCSGGGVHQSISFRFLR